MNENGSSSTSSRAVRRNALWNIFGQGFPLVLAVFCIPLLIKGIGTDRFGALTLVWTVLTYFTLFDLGLGRALTQLLAGGIKKNDKDEADLIWTTSALLAGLGFIAAIILFFSAPLIASRLLRLQGPLQSEMILSLRELGFTLPLLIHGLALRGILEARRRFDLSNLIRIPLGIFTYGAPVLILPFSHSLSTIVSMLLAGRVLAWALNLWMVLRIIPHLRSFPNWRPKRLKELLKFGGWVTITSIVAPITDNIDRFFITAMLTISMVAYYTTPFELISKLWVVSLGIGGAIFPEFASRFHRNRKEAEELYLRGFKYLLATLFPLVLFATAYAKEGLSLWLNPSFAQTGAPVLQWLALAMLIAGVRMISFTFLLGIGRPRLPALNDLLELPLHAIVLYVFLKLGGVKGAAIAYVIRCTIGFLILFFCSGALLKFDLTAYKKTLLPLGLASIVLIGFHIGMAPLLKAVLVAITFGAYLCFTWLYVLEGKDKALVRKKIGLTRS